MQQLDLFGAIQETKPESNIQKVADKDLHVVHVNEIEKAHEDEPPVKEEIKIEERIEREEKIESEENNTDGNPIAFEMPELNGKTVTEKPTKEIAKQEPKESKRGRKSYKEMEAEAENVELPDDEILFQKQYYTISEVAEWFKVNTSLLRYWENEFDILKPRKTRKGDRLFRPEDVKNLRLIYFLLRQRKFSLEGAKQYLKENKNKVDAQMVLIQSLTKFRSFLLEWKAILGA
jgi:DNA-binding transcriptional MerR regulator